MPILLRSMEAKILGVATNELGMLIERISYEDNKVVEFSKSVSPGNKFKYHVILGNKD